MRGKPLTRLRVALGARHALCTPILFALGLGSISATVESRPAVVELYTSEGCSSCPPAEQLLEQLAQRPDVLALAFHVDYWDELGWHDRFSMQDATGRQQNTARVLGLATVGTPQIVVDGRTTIWGASREAVERALKTPRSDLPVEIFQRGSNLIVRAQAPASREPYAVYAVGYLPKAVTPISRGENAGRTLTEVNIVRYIRKIGTSSDSVREWSLALEGVPKDAERVAIILQVPATGAIVGARTAVRDEVGSTR